jgi:hypothetical protein
MFTTSIQRWIAQPVCLALSLAIVAVPGCATNKPGTPSPTADTCKPQREAFRGYDDYFGKSMLIGAGLGAVAGGLIGYAIKQDAKAALTGAAVGAAAGAAGGYWQAVSQQKADRAAQTQQVLTDVNADNDKISAIQASFDTLVACRRGQADTIRADYKAGRIPRDQAETQMAAVKKRYEDDVAFAQKIDGKIAERSANFQFATEQLTPQPYLVTAATAVVYSSPDDKSKVVTRLKTNAQLTAQNQDENWLQVPLPTGGNGYVQRAQVTAASALPPQQTAAATPATPSKAAPPSKKGTKPAPAPAPTVATTAPTASAKDPLSQGVYTNVAKRTDFGNSVKTAAASSNGFELGTT